MNFTETEAVLALLVVLLAGVAIWLWLRNRRTAEIKSHFGPEYERTVDRVGDENKAVDVLAERQKRVASYTIRPLEPEARDRFIGRWREVQSDFVDDPSGAVTHADDLLAEVMKERGYPVHDFDQQAEDLSVDHPQVVEHYRTAHDIAERHSRGEASTEDLRKAMIHYRALFDDLVNEPTPENAKSSKTPKERTNGKQLARG